MTARALLAACCALVGAPTMLALPSARRDLFGMAAKPTPQPTAAPTAGHITGNTCTKCANYTSFNNFCTSSTRMRKNTRWG